MEEASVGKRKVRIKGEVFQKLEMRHSAADIIQEKRGYKLKVPPTVKIISSCLIPPTTNAY